MQSVEKYKTNLGEVQCLIHVSNNLIHVLDVNNDGTTSVTNGIEQIQQQILQKHNLSGDVSNYTWILHGTDGIAYRYDGTFSTAPKEMQLQQFSKIAKTMANK